MALAAVVVLAVLADLASCGPLLSCVQRSSSEDESNACATLHPSALSDKADVRDTIDELISRAFYTSTERLVDATQLNGGVSQADLSTTVFQASTRVQRRLSMLQEKVSLSQKAAGIPPAFEWAQSPDTIFINVKFAHKLDTPATLGCEADPPVFESSGVTLRAECREKRKMFLLSLATFKPLAVENCTWSMNSVGRASITLKKGVNSTWPRLLASDARKPGNMHVWWAMKEAHEEENKGWEKSLREREKAEEKRLADIANGTAPTPSPSPTASTSAAAAAEGSDSSMSSSTSSASDASLPQSESSTPSPSVAESASPLPNPVEPTPEPTPEDPVAVLERQKAKEIGEASTGEAAELRSIDSESAMRRKTLEERCRSERGVIEKDVGEQRRNATNRWQELRQTMQEKYTQLIDAAKQTRDATAESTTGSDNTEL